MTLKWSKLAMVALPVCVAAQALGVDINVARVILNPNISGGGGPVDHTVQGAGTVDATGSTTGGGNSSGQGTAHVEYGVIKLTGGALGSLSESSYGQFRDALTITSPGVPINTPGTLVFTVQVQGSLSATAGSSASTWTLQADLGGGVYDMNRTAHCYSPDVFPSGCSGDPYGTHSATIAFQYGVAMPLDVELTVSAQASFSANGPGAASFGSPFTLNWAGISDVTANGLPLGNYTIASESGTSWGGTISPNPCPGDLNHDGMVDGADLGAMLGAWGGTGAADLNSDGTVDGADLGALLGAWGPCP